MNERKRIEPSNQVQTKGLQKRGGGDSSEQIHQAAEAGTSGGGGAMPFADRIQESFGSFDVSGIRAHTGGAAQKANEQLGSMAYASGNNVAFRGAPDLFTAAHEAAHVIQQQAGVQLRGGVGEAGDRYEQHADAVAARVVQGKSAEDLLTQFTGRTAERIQYRSVQHRAPVQKQDAQAAAAFNHMGRASGAFTPDAGASAAELSLGGLASSIASAWERHKASYLLWRPSTSATDVENCLATSLQVHNRPQSFSFWVGGVSWCRIELTLAFDTSGGGFSNASQAEVSAHSSNSGTSAQLGGNVAATGPVGPAGVSVAAGGGVATSSSQATSGASSRTLGNAHGHASVRVARCSVHEVGGTASRTSASYEGSLGRVSGSVRSQAPTGGPGAPAVPTAPTPSAPTAPSGPAAPTPVAPTAPASSGGAAPGGAPSEAAAAPAAAAGGG